LDENCVEAQSKREAAVDEAGVGGLKPATQASSFTTMVTPKETSLQHLEFFRTQLEKHCPRQQVQHEWHTDLYLYPTQSVFS